MSDNPAPLHITQSHNLTAHIEYRYSDTSIHSNTPIPKNVSRFCLGWQKTFNVQQNPGHLYNHTPIPKNDEFLSHARPSGPAVWFCPSDWAPQTAIESMKPKAPKAPQSRPNSAQSLPKTSKYPFMAKCVFRRLHSTLLKLMCSPSGSKGKIPNRSFQTHYITFWTRSQKDLRSVQS